MKRPLTKLGLSLALIVFPRFALSVMGCVCLPLPTPYKEYGEAKAVFVGKVLSSKDIAAQEQFQDRSYTYYDRHYRFSVAESLKAITSSEIEISAGRIDTDCFQGFTVGETYLVYAYGDSPEALSSGACTRTNTSSDDLYYLHALLKGIPESRVYGGVTRIENDLTKTTSARTSSGKGEPVKIRVGKVNEPLRVVIPFPKPEQPDR